MLKNEKNILRTLNTVSHLKPQQALTYIARRVLPESTFIPVKSSVAKKSLLLDKPIAINGIYVDDKTFRFLNHEASITANLQGWTVAEASRLWQYNLHYFDYLREDDRSLKNKDELIDSWIKLNPGQSKPGWEAYTTSLRIVNWIFYLHEHTDEAINIEWLDSLYNQVLWLESNDEKHILANHYFENLKALLFAGCYFESKDAERWCAYAKKELLTQLKEQNLSDGGHYERSPQYHCLMLENYLDIYNLAKNNDECFDKKFIETVKQTAIKALDYLDSILFPDNDIPFFNDSARHDLYKIDALFTYAKNLFGYIRPGVKSELINKDDSGLYGWRSKKDMFVIDCGEIGPSYQPGHTHCDFLSYELMFNGKKVIVNSGVYEYSSGEMRDYVRSTKAHNTLTVDGDDQSELWGEFRVARRAKKQSANIFKKNKTVMFNGSFRGFYKLSGKITHKREVQIELDNDEKFIQQIVISDLVTGNKKGSRVDNYIHFHPDMSLFDDNNGTILIKNDDISFAKIEVNSEQDYRVETSFYCPEFGIKLENPCVVFTKTGDKKITTQYTISRLV